MEPINLLEYWIGIYNGYRGISSDTKFEKKMSLSFQGCRPLTTSLS